ncbi:MAG: cytochrome c biogenesis CcdA family protein [Alphaproteobacteria bacterium]|nr:cytochrome c biogenesis CcdA family protein [Alphaproteobacteria bacterium]
MDDMTAYVTALFAGVISFLSPCVLPLVPPYICYLAGISLDQMKKGPALTGFVQWHISWMAILFVLGFTSIFVLLGLSASVIGRFLTVNTNFLTKISGFFIIFMGIHMTGLIRIPLLYRDVRYKGWINLSSYMGAYLMGLAFAFGWTPCIGPILSSILFISANEETIYKGMFLLMLYSLGLGIPFVLVTFLTSPFFRFLDKVRPYLRVIEIVAGNLLILAGIAFIRDEMKYISYFLLEMFPHLSEIG